MMERVLGEGFVCKRWVFVCSVSEFSHSLKGKYYR